MLKNTLQVYEAYVIKAGDVNLNGINIQERTITLASYKQKIIYLHHGYFASWDETAFEGNGRYPK